MKPKCSCLIPFYNEGERVLNVLEVVCQIPQIDQIVVVDDGSQDQSWRLIEGRFPRVELIRLTENEGKSRAMWEGLQRVTNEYLLTLDADLRNLEANFVQEGIHRAMENPGIDMVIFRLQDRLLSQFFRTDIVISGQRVLRRDDLAQVCCFQLENYQIEAAINQFMIDEKKNVYWMPIRGRNTPVVRKRGPVKGVVRNLYLFANIIAYTGLLGYLKQLAFFARQPLPV